MHDMTDSASPTVAEALPLVKPCTKCGVEKLLVDFSLNKSGKFGRSFWCKSCMRAYSRGYYQRPENRERKRAYRQSPEYREWRRAHRQCLDYKEWQRVYAQSYRQCPEYKEWLRARRQRPEYKEWQQAYLQRPGVKERQRARKQSPEYKEWKRAYVRGRRTDLDFKLQHNLRNRLRKALQGRSKSARTLELIGCDIGFLRRWLEAKFQPGMTWENYGGWHIDHIMPCASFDLSDPVQQRTCFRWTNLQPLWAADNIRKSDNYAP